MLPCQLETCGGLLPRPAPGSAQRLMSNSLHISLQTRGESASRTRCVEFRRGTR